jgi:cytidine deaminase
MQETIAGRPVDDMRRLWLAARAVAANAYAPYSGLRVGAALESVGGRTFTGVNVENASYPAGLCAERAALAAAVAAGERRFSALAVTTDSGASLTPCGACLQALAEFGDLDVVTAAPAPTSGGAQGSALGAARKAAPEAAPAASPETAREATPAAAPAVELRVVALRDLLSAPFRLPGEGPGPR